MDSLTRRSPCIPIMAHFGGFLPLEWIQSTLPKFKIGHEKLSFEKGTDHLPATIFQGRAYWLSFVGVYSCIRSWLFGGFKDFCIFYPYLGKWSNLTSNRPWVYVCADRIVTSLVWHGLISFSFAGPCWSIESQHDCEEHPLVMESDWQWRSSGLVAFGRFREKNDISWIRLILVWNMSFFTSCRLHPFFLALGRLAPIPCQRFLEDLAHLLNHLSNAINVLQVSNINSTYSTHRIHVRYIYLHLL